MLEQQKDSLNSLQEKASTYINLEQWRIKVMLTPMRAMVTSYLSSMNIQALKLTELAILHTQQLITYIGTFQARLHLMMLWKMRFLKMTILMKLLTSVLSAMEHKNEIQY